MNVLVDAKWATILILSLTLGLGAAIWIELRPTDELVTAKVERSEEAEREIIESSVYTPRPSKTAYDVLKIKNGVEVITPSRGGMPAPAAAPPARRFAIPFEMGPTNVRLLGMFSHLDWLTIPAGNVPMLTALCFLAGTLWLLIAAFTQHIAWGFAVLFACLSGGVLFLLGPLIGGVLFASFHPARAGKPVVLQWIGASLGFAAGYLA